MIVTDRCGSLRSQLCDATKAGHQPTSHHVALSSPSGRKETSNEIGSIGSRQSQHNWKDFIFVQSSKFLRNINQAPFVSEHLKQAAMVDKRVDNPQQVKFGHLSRTVFLRTSFPNLEAARPWKRSFSIVANIPEQGSEEGGCFEHSE